MSNGRMIIGKERGRGWSGWVVISITSINPQTATWNISMF